MRDVGVSMNSLIGLTSGCSFHCSYIVLQSVMEVIVSQLAVYLSVARWF